MPPGNVEYKGLFYDRYQFGTDGIQWPIVLNSTVGNTTTTVKLVRRRIRRSFRNMGSLPTCMFQVTIWSLEKACVLYSTHAY
eukprot:jgi/Botrbrau1/1826/Bobra.146_1s0022.1